MNYNREPGRHVYTQQASHSITFSLKKKRKKKKSMVAFKRTALYKYR